MPAPTDSVAITALPAVATATGADIYPVVQGGVTSRETNAQLLTYIQGAIAIPLAQISDASANGRSLVAAANYAAMLTLLGAAPLASPTFTGVPAAPTAAPGTNTTQLATTAFVLANAGVGSVTNVTASAPLASSGGATPDISITGTVPVANGGTGITSYAIGDILYASAATTLAKLADVATGNALISGGVTTAPSWGKIGLTTHVSGILPAANGGTGIDNSTRTLTISTNAGTLAFSAAASTLTVPATGTAALLATANAFTAAQSITIDDAATNAVTTLLTLDHSSSGTPAASFGTRLLWNLESNTTLARNAFAMDTYWSTATDGTRTSRTDFLGVQSAAALATVLSIAGNQVIFSGILKATTNNGVEMSTGLGSAGAPNYTFSSDNDTGMWRVGANTLGFSTNAIQKVNIGSDGATWIRGDDAGTNAVLNVLTIGHNTSGTPAAGYGTGLVFQGESTTTVDTTMADEQVSWVVPTHASRTAKRVFSIYDTAARTAMTMQASGSAAMLGLYSATPVVQAAAISAPAGGAFVDAEARTAIASILTAIGAAAGGIGITA